MSLPGKTGRLIQLRKFMQVRKRGTEEHEWNVSHSSGSARQRMRAHEIIVTTGEKREEDE